MSNEVLTGLLAVVFVCPLVISGISLAAERHTRGRVFSTKILFPLPWLLSVGMFGVVAQMGDERYSNRSSDFFGYWFCGGVAIIISAIIMIVAYFDD